jgi:hypothetical protein
VLKAGAGAGDAVPKVKPCAGTEAELLLECGSCKAGKR